MLAWGCFVENKEKAAHECLTFLAYKAPFISSDPIHRNRPYPNYYFLLLGFNFSIDRYM
jgi:hypothetical protein